MGIQHKRILQDKYYQQLDYDRGVKGGRRECVRGKKFIRNFEKD
jgi:hypothetical protein